jgi:hypothetical protein
MANKKPYHTILKKHTRNNYAIKQNKNIISIYFIYLVLFYFLLLI